jgi:hypothetical protein
MTPESEHVSDRELSEKEPHLENISVSVWNFIVTVYEQLIEDRLLACRFPKKDCSYYPEAITGCDKTALEFSLKGEIPSLKTPVEYCREDNFTPFESWQAERYGLPDKYVILDFLEFLHKNIVDVIEYDIDDGIYRSLANHYEFYTFMHIKHKHYSFSERGKNKALFRKKINDVFRRNGIVFYLDDDGLARRAVPKMIANIISNVEFETEDVELNDMLKVAYHKFTSPHPEMRKEAIDRLWDAFEQLKTYLSSDKKKPAGKIIKDLSGNNVLFGERVEKEFRELTDIGHIFHIRHIERHKSATLTDLQINYLFYRMSSLICLCLESYRKQKPVTTR